MPERTVGICLLGLGVVGSGVARILSEQRALLRSRTGINFEIRRIVVRDPARHAAQCAASPAAHPLPASLFTADASAAIADPAVDIVVEVVGGVEHAHQYLRKALSLGKPAVTANKSLLALRGPELFALARQNNTCIAFEASCAGGIPIIHALQSGLIANRIDALVGIVNGTCNVILTRMTRNGWSYATALKEAQQNGFAEADPALDVSGRDAAQKLTLLAGLAFNARIVESDIHVEGIDTLQESEIKYARELGYVIKLLAIAERVGGDSLALRVHPTLVHQDDPLAEVSGPFNAVSVWGHALGHTLFYGRGAGQMPTASAVVADLVGVALGTTPLAFKQLNIFPDSTPAASILPFEKLRSRYYLRMMVRDEPGVFAQITRILGEHRISLSAILQHELDEGQYVPIVITTHMAQEGQVQAALAEVRSMPIVAPGPVCLRIIDQPREFAPA